MNHLIFSFLLPNTRVANLRIQKPWSKSVPIIRLAAPCTTFHQRLKHWQVHKTWHHVLQIRVLVQIPVVSWVAVCLESSCALPLITRPLVSQGHHCSCCCCCLTFWVDKKTHSEKNMSDVAFSVTFVVLTIVVNIAVTIGILRYYTKHDPYHIVAYICLFFALFLNLCFLSLLPIDLATFVHFFLKIFWQRLLFALWQFNRQFFQHSFATAKCNNRRHTKWWCTIVVGDTVAYYLLVHNSFGLDCAATHAILCSFGSIYSAKKDAMVHYWKCTTNCSLLIFFQKDHLVRHWICACWCHNDWFDHILGCNAATYYHPKHCWNCAGSE